MVGVEEIEYRAVPTRNVEDEPDRLYATVEQKEDAITAEVAGAHTAGRPVLIGTLNIEESERLAGRLDAAAIVRLLTALNAPSSC